MRDYLKVMREQKALSQQEVAESLNVTRQYYNLIESGGRQAKMDIEILQKLAGIFGVSVDFILAEENKIRKSS